MAATYRLTPIRRIGNVLIAPAAWLGLAGRRTHVLRALKTERVQVEEVGAEEAAPVLREYLRTTGLVKPYFDADADSPLDAFAAEAARHPVFRLRP